jgi:phage replication initiation protein
MNRTFPDFYTFRARSDYQDVFEALRLAVGGHGYLLGHTIQPGGKYGYEKHSLLNFAGKQVGLLAWGGEQQLGWVYASLSGAGCDFVESWDFFEAVVQALPEFGYRRVDLTLDVRDGSCSHEATVAAYRAGQFDSRGKRPPAERIEPEDREQGCTIYVGHRKRWRFFRGYDKGREIRAKSGQPGLTHIGGVRVEDLYRLEVEFKAVDGLALPLDLVSDRDKYFAGAFPYLAAVLEGVEPRPFRIHRRDTIHADLVRTLSACQRMYGPALRAALSVHGGDMKAVWAQIVGDRITDRWLAAGANLKAEDL